MPPLPSLPPKWHRCAGRQRRQKEITSKRLLDQAQVSAVYPLFGGSSGYHNPKRSNCGGHYASIQTQVHSNIFLLYGSHNRWRESRPPSPDFPDRPPLWGPTAGDLAIFRPGWVAWGIFDPRQLQNRNFQNRIFDVVTVHNDETCYVKHVLDPLDMVSPHLGAGGGGGGVQEDGAQAAYAIFWFWSSFGVHTSFALFPPPLLEVPCRRK